MQKRPQKPQQKEARRTSGLNFLPFSRSEPVPRGKPREISLFKKRRNEKISSIKGIVRGESASAGKGGEPSIASSCRKVDSVMKKGCQVYFRPVMLKGGNRHKCFPLSLNGFPKKEEKDKLSEIRAGEKRGEQRRPDTKEKGAVRRLNERVYDGKNHAKKKRGRQGESPKKGLRQALHREKDSGGALAFGFRVG